MEQTKGLSLHFDQLQSSAREVRLPHHENPTWHDPRFDTFLGPLLKRARLEADTNLPMLSDELYSDFGKTGNRLGFEKVYFERRRQLARAAVALLRTSPNSADYGKLSQSLIEKWKDVAFESSWALPAHVEDQSGKSPLTIDLFAAETANLLTDLHQVFPHILPQGLWEEMKEILKIRILDNYLTRHKEFWWTTATHNWNAVCHHGVIGAALLVEENPARLASFIALSKGYLQGFLDGFADDGGCTEGPSYWESGFGRFAELNAQIEARTGGMFSLFEERASLKRIAEYGAGMVLPGGTTINFADCNKRTFRPALLCYLGERLDSHACSRLGKLLYTRLLGQPADLDAQRADFFYFSRLLKDIPPAWNQSAEGYCSEGVYWPHLGVAVFHGQDRAGLEWHGAVKAGHNDEHHNHNDCGSFILVCNGYPLVIEIGSPEYVREYFHTASRYSFLAARSFGHSVPLINGCEQTAGATRRSRFLYHEDGPAQAEFLLDLTECYPAEAACQSAIRKMRLDKIGGIFAVEDLIELSDWKAIETSLILNITISIRDNVAEAVAGGMTFSFSAENQSDRWEATEECYRGHDGENASITRLSLRPAAVLERNRLAYTISLKQNER